MKPELRFPQRGTEGGEKERSAAFKNTCGFKSWTPENLHSKQTKTAKSCNPRAARPTADLGAVFQYTIRGHARTPVKWGFFLRIGNKYVTIGNKCVTYFWSR